MPRRTHPDPRGTQPRRLAGRHTPEESPKTPEGYARQLVTRGLASIRILDYPMLAQRTNPTHERQGG